MARLEGGKPSVRPMRYLCRPEGMDPATDYTKTGQVSGEYNAWRDNFTKLAWILHKEGE